MATQATYISIPKSSGRYMTMAESLRARGDEFMARGDKYWEEGRKSHAEGCWKKAEKKYLHARALEDFGQTKWRKDQRVKA